MKLTAEEQRLVAHRAQWYFDCYFGQGTDDSVVYTGDGVDDLDRLISILSNTKPGVNARFQCDVSPGNYSSYKPFDIEDVVAIRGYYVGWYGEVNKPDAYAKR